MQFQIEIKGHPIIQLINFTLPNSIQSSHTPKKRMNGIFLKKKIVGKKGNYQISEGGELRVELCRECRVQSRLFHSEKNGVINIIACG